MEWWYNLHILNLIIRCGERASHTHWTWGWVGPSSSLVAVEKTITLVTPGIKPQFLDCRAHSLVTTMNRLFLLRWHSTH